MRHYDGRRDGGRTDDEKATASGGRPPRTAEDDVDNGLNGGDGCGKVDYAQGDGRSASHSPVSLFLRAQSVFIILAVKP